MKYITIISVLALLVITYTGIAHAQRSVVNDALNIINNTGSSPVEFKGLPTPIEIDIKPPLANNNQYFKSFPLTAEVTSVEKPTIDTTWFSEYITNLKQTSHGRDQLTSLTQRSGAYERLLQDINNNMLSDNDIMLMYTYYSSNSINESMSATEIIDKTTEKLENQLFQADNQQLTENTQIKSLTKKFIFADLATNLLKMVQLNPKDAESYLRLSFIYEKHGMHKERMISCYNIVKLSQYTSLPENLTTYGQNCINDASKQIAMLN